MTDEIQKEIRRRYQGEERRASEIQRLQAMARLTEAVEHLADQFMGNQEAISNLQKDLSQLKAEIQKDLNKLQSDIQKENAELKADLITSRVDYKSFLKGYDKQIELYNKINDDHEERLRVAKNPYVCSQLHRFEALESDNKDQNKLLYKIIGALLLLGPLLTLLAQWFIKHFIKN